jgi:hypothetical protein
MQIEEFAVCNALKELSKNETFNLCISKVLIRYLIYQLQLCSFDSYIRCTIDECSGKSYCLNCHFGVSNTMIFVNFHGHRRRPQTSIWILTTCII